MMCPNAPARVERSAPTRRLRWLSAISGVVLLMVALSDVVVADQLRTFQASFVRDYVAGKRKEQSSGNIYFDSAAQKLVLEVTAPVHQWLILHGNEILLYYPEARQAFRLSSRSDAAMPFFQVILNGFKEDFGLAEQGYSVSSHDTRGGALSATWTPSKKLSKALGPAVLNYENNRLVRVEYKTARGNLLTRVLFGNPTAVKGYSFPLDVSISYGSPNGVAEERVIYANALFDLPIPASVKGLAVPAGIAVKDIVW